MRMHLCTKIFFILLISCIKWNTAEAQKRYRHIPRVKIKKETSFNPSTEPTIRSYDGYETAPDTPPIHKIIEKTPENTTNIVVDDPSTPTVNHVTITSHYKPPQKPTSRTAKPSIKTSRLRKHHPLHTMMDADELNMMAWISVVACVTFIGGIIINFVLAGFSTWVIVFIILSAVFAVAAIIFFVLEATIGE